MKLPATKISDKVLSMSALNLLGLIITTIATKTPLATNPWAEPFQDTAFVVGILTLAGFVLGYQTEETAFRRNY